MTVWIALYIRDKYINNEILRSYTSENIKLNSVYWRKCKTFVRNYFFGNDARTIYLHQTFTWNPSVEECVGNFYVDLISTQRSGVESASGVNAETWGNSSMDFKDIL